MEALELAFAGIARQAELIRAGEVSPRELVEVCLERIGRLDPHLNAFRTVLAERALAEADQAEARRGSGDERPLLGVPVAIKDDVDVAGEVTAHGSLAHGGPAEADAEVVRLLRAAGAIVIGKTNVPELEQWPFTETAAFGVTRNPWALDRTPGGSSGGSAAAVAAGLVGAALGSDGAGSIRIPSSCCGLVGLKPQLGRIPKRPGWHGLSVVGPLTRRTADAALFLDVTGTGEPPRPERPFAEAVASPPGKLRVAVSAAIPKGVVAKLDPEVRGALDETAALLRSLGHDVGERDPDYAGSALDVTARYLRGIRDDARAMARPERLERRTRGMARLGGLIPERAFARLREGEAALAARINAIFDEVDVLVSPVLAWQPVEVGRWEGRGALATLAGPGGVAAFCAYTPPWNGTGNPAVAVPAGFAASGAPIGVQLVGRPNDEWTPLALAAQLEAERGWPEQRPPMATAEPAASPRPPAPATR